MATQTLLNSYPKYDKTAELDRYRAKHYGHLGNHVYVDYAGAGLAAEHQYAAHSKRLANAAFGNPHSASPTSKAATDLIEEARERVLHSLNASTEEYVVIFTPNATGAARLIGEAYPFDRHRKLALTSDNHNSINGLREFARYACARVDYVHARRRDLRIDTVDIEDMLQKRAPSISRWLVSCCTHRLTPTKPVRHNGLFAFPAQSNFSGVRHPLSWISLAQKRGYDVLLDAAAYLPTEELDLSEVKPEFVIMSWYKIFGYPTGLGCLVAKRDALGRLTRPWFSGGTVQAVSVGMRWQIMASEAAAFEDGTVNFLSIPDITVGLDWMAKIGKALIKERVYCLTEAFLYRLKRLCHSNKRPMAVIYGPEDMESRGGTVCFNLVDTGGHIVDARHVAAKSADANISLRTGCFCNPGASEDAFLRGKKNVRHHDWSGAASVDEYIRLMGLPPGGAVRVSFGLISTAHDVDRLFDFAISEYKDKAIERGIMNDDKSLDESKNNTNRVFQQM